MKKEKKKPVIAITMGDPVGIGPEIIVKALSEPMLYEICDPLILGDVRVLSDTAKWLEAKVICQDIEKKWNGQYAFGSINVLNLSAIDPIKIKYGEPSPATGAAMLHYITKAIDMAMEGAVAAMVTAPINKHAMHLAGFEFEGHTEILAQRTGSSEYVMMLAGEKLKVSLVTIHCALSEVPARITRENIYKTISITHKAIKESFGIDSPRLAVAALNPHAGEKGLFGDEEFRVIMPAIEKAQAAGINAAGPFPPDTLFYHACRNAYDAVICMYHDQGLIPFKMLHFSDGVNITLGLPIIRTSVDHGTAYDIAGQGNADAGSLIAAIHMAARQALLQMERS
ncbi:MAG: 4-hydroxythreonine-4-phosphate dehydrogenase PdxA [Pseudomonadota bacterium]